MMHFRFRLKRNFQSTLQNVLFTFVFSTALSCGTGRSPGQKGAEADYEDVVVNIQSADVSTRAGLTLSGATQFTAEIKGCASGYTFPLNENTGGIKVQKDDLNCFFRLNTMTSNGEVFDFSTVADGNFALGGKFNVVGRSGTSAEFSVAKQLTSPVSGVQEVLMLFGTSGKGQPQTAEAGVNAAVTLAGADDIELTSLVFDVSVSSNAPTLGFGVFGFDLGCSSKSGTVDEGGVLKCGTVTLADLKFGLTADTSKGGEIGLEACKAIAAAPGDLGKVFPAQSVGFPNGGLRTTKLFGPGRLYDPAQSKLVFAISSPGSSGGCRYFRIGVKAP